MFATAVIRIILLWLMSVLQQLLGTSIMNV